MTNPITKLFSVALATTLAAAAHGATAPTEAAPTSGASRLDNLLGDPVIAKAKGVEIKRSQLDAEMVKVQAMASARQQQIPPAQMPLIERQKLNDLIDFQLLLQRATDADKAKGKEQFAKMLKRIKTVNKLTDAEFDEKLATNLRREGVTRAEWDKQRLDQGIVGAVLERELKISISDDAAKKFYDENPSRFEQPEQVRASHILLSTRDLATGTELSEELQKTKRKQMDALHKRAVGGEDFAKLAKEFSEDNGTKDEGGEITLAKGAQGVPPEFEAAAFSLTTNQVSDVITSQIGYHLIKLNEKIPAKMVAFADVSDELKEALKAQELQKQLSESDFLEKLRRDAKVEILDEKVKKLYDLLEAGKPEPKPDAQPAEKMK
jgi:peptidyl-prolyl cis-trans isomerase C